VRTERVPEVTGREGRKMMVKMEEKRMGWDLRGKGRTNQRQRETEVLKKLKKHLVTLSLQQEL